MDPGRASGHGMSMDVIVAPATPWGHAALAVVRLTGPGTLAVLEAITTPLRPGPWRPGRQRRVDVRDADGVFDDGVVVVGLGPRTYTGEDTAELTVHGSPVIVERVLAAATAAGARLASPGAFTRRAYEHGKLDLVRAEAVLQATGAKTSAALAVARAGTDGALHQVLDGLRERLVGAAAELEVRFDHPEEDLGESADHEVVAALRAVAADAQALAATQAAGRVMVEGARVALVGAVNAGKSSLFNALLGRTRALVHPSGGTTRDVLEVAVPLGGVPITLLDTAGERPTTDPVEAAGQALAGALVDEADLVVVVLRARAAGLSGVEEEILTRTAGRPRVVVCNGVDVEGVVVPPAAQVRTVATTGAGVPALVQAIQHALVGEAPGHASLVIASSRQRDLLEAVARLALEAVEALPVAGIVVAAERAVEAVEVLDALTGADTREEVLDALFSRFCIGK